MIKLEAKKAKLMNQISRQQTAAATPSLVANLLQNTSAKAK